MTSKEFVVSKIDELAENFPKFKFSYQMDQASETHFIEVLPKSLFEQFESPFVEKQNQLILDFIKSFPFEGVAFISEDDLFMVDRPEYVKCGIDFNKTVPNLSWNHKQLNELLEDFRPEIQSSFVIDQRINEIRQQAITCVINLKEDKNAVDLESVTNNLPASTIGSDTVLVDDITDDQNYCLAA